MSTDLHKVKVVFTSNAQKMELHVSLENTTLGELKDLIMSTMTMDERNPRIRVFHLGRELKSGGRSLETLGIGRFRNYTIHVHHVATRGSNCTTTNNNHQNEFNGEPSCISRTRPRTTVQYTALKQQPPPQAQPPSQGQPSSAQVVDLLQDSDDEAAATAKRPRLMR